MGTRATVTVISYDEPVVNVYTQYDGYPSGFGELIKKTLNNGEVTIINGISGNQYNPTHFNGMSCLAAYLVKELKDGIGGIYLHPLHSKEEYHYTLTDLGRELYMQVENHGETIYKGLLKDFDSKKLTDY